MKAYSLDLRQRTVRAYEQGQGTIPEIAQRFSVSAAFVNKLLRQWRVTGELAALPHGGGKPPSLSNQHLLPLKRAMQQQDDLSLAELQNLLSEQQRVNVRLSTIPRALARPGLPRKKVPSRRRAQQLQAGLVLAQGLWPARAPLALH